MSFMIRKLHRNYRSKGWCDSKNHFGIDGKIVFHIKKVEGLYEEELVAEKHFEFNGKKLFIG